MNNVDTVGRTKDDSVNKTSAAVRVVESKSVVARPPFKFLGGKTKLLPSLRALEPADFGNYYEPFVGGGAYFWDLAARGRIKKGGATISDANLVVIRTLRALKREVDAVVALLAKMPITQEHYMAIRGTSLEDRAAMSDAELAAWFLFVNKTGFNGLFRVTKSGKFNVPWGHWQRQKRMPRVLDEPLLRSCANVLREFKVRVRKQLFETVLDTAVKGDLVYMDPPYLPSSATSDFTSYTMKGFTYDDHVRVRDVALELKTRGVHVLLSNSDVSLIRELYESKPGFRIDEVESARSINSKGSGRGKVKELIIR